MASQYIPYPSPRQAQDLMVELKCNVWSASLLEDVYAGIDRYTQSYHSLVMLLMFFKPGLTRFRQLNLR
jgi:hypothetical protein